MYFYFFLLILFKTRIEIERYNYNLYWIIYYFLKLLFFCKIIRESLTILDKTYNRKCEIDLILLI